MPMFGGGGYNPNQQFGGGYDPATGAMSLSGGVASQFQMPPTASLPPMAPPTQAPASPSFLGQGGVGRSIAGYIGDYLAKLGGGNAIYGPMQLQRAQLDRQMSAQAAMQQAEYQRQLALAKYNKANPTPTSLQQNYEYLRQTKPDLAEQYLRSQANPMTLSTDPATGNVVFIPKGGIPGMNAGEGGPSVPTVSNDADYSALPSGAQFKDPQGNVRVKP